MLFSDRKCKEAEDFFRRHRRQALVEAVESDAVDETLGGDAEQDSHDELVDALLGDAPTSLDSPEALAASMEVAGCSSVSSCAIGLDDDEIEDGVDEELEDSPPDEVIDDDVELPKFDEFRLKKVKELQRDDESQQIKRFVKGEETPPGKTEALVASHAVKHYLRHRSWFRVTPQDVLIRRWVDSRGAVTDLIVVGEDEFKTLVKDTHSNPISSHRHFGVRKTFTAMNQVYFAFRGRLILKQVIAQCATCALNNYPKNAKECEGNQIVSRSNEAGCADLAGPISGIGRSAAGRSRYVFVYCDLHSRFVFSKVLSSCADKDVLGALVDLKNQLCGFPSSFLCDNALLTSRSESLKFLKENGVRILHGLAYVSRCQSRCERTIGTLFRLICKLSTDQPTLPFHRLVSESTQIINSSPSDGLPQGLCPKDVFFNSPPSNFLMHQSMSSAKSRGVSKLASELTLKADVERFLKRRNDKSASDYSSRLKVGDLCLKKKMRFPNNVNKKLAFKLHIDCFKIMSRVGTNSFRCQSLRDGNNQVLPGDVLVRVKSLDEAGLLELCREMEKIASRNAVVGDDDEVETPLLSARRDARRDADEDAEEARQSNQRDGRRSAGGDGPATRLRSRRRVNAVEILDLDCLFRETDGQTAH